MLAPDHGELHRRQDLDAELRAGGHRRVDAVEVVVVGQRHRHQPGLLHHAHDFGGRIAAVGASAVQVQIDVRAVIGDW